MQNLTTAINSEPLVSETVEALVADLDPTLRYHSPDHTKDVLRQTLELAEADSLEGRDVLLLAIAAAFHDAGFLVQRPQNEPIGAQMAVDAMARSGRFSSTEQSLVEQMILDTQLVFEGPAQVANCRLSPWLLDADLANLGRDDFWDKTGLLAEEMEIELSAMWPMTQALMLRHEWQSPAGQRLFGDKKRANFLALEDKLSKNK